MKSRFPANLLRRIKSRIGRILRGITVATKVTNLEKVQVNLLRLETQHTPLKVEISSPSNVSQLLENKMNEDMFDFITENMMSAVWLEYRERV